MTRKKQAVSKEQIEEALDNFEEAVGPIPLLVNRGLALKLAAVR